MKFHVFSSLAATMLVCGLATVPPSAAAQERVYTYSYRYDGPVYGYGPAYGYGPVYGYRDPAGSDYAYERGLADGENRALGTYVPRSDDDLRESRRFFRGIARQSGGQ